jgi:hypothetical protein
LTLNPDLNKREDVQQLEQRLTKREDHHP